MLEQSRAEQSRAEQSRAEQSRAEQYKILLFDRGDYFEQLAPLYDAEVAKGNMEIIGCGELNNGKYIVRTNPQMLSAGDKIEFNAAVISSRQGYYDRVQLLRRWGVPDRMIVDGKTFAVPGFDFPRFMREGTVYGTMPDELFRDVCYSIYPRHYKAGTTDITLGRKSYVISSYIDNVNRNGILEIGDFTAVSWLVTFEIGLNDDHNLHNVSSFGCHFDWDVPPDYLPYYQKDRCRLIIGSDVWIGRGAIIKSNNPDKPTIIGNGAVIASDSVVVSSVPPYAIVGGNPARLIKYRFAPAEIDAFQAIKWWEWDMDKIHDNFSLFNRPQEFLRRFAR